MKNAETSARRRFFLAVAVCCAAAAIAAFGWVKLIYPSFCGGAYSDFKPYPHQLFLPATFFALVLDPAGNGLKKALFCEAFFICFSVFLFGYFLIAALCRKRID